MGKLTKNHLARLIVLTAAACTFLLACLYVRPIILTEQLDQVAAALEGFFWPKIFWDFLTKNFDGAVKPVPVLQIINLIFGIISLLWEWPINFWGFPESKVHKSFEARIMLYPLFALAAILLYQSTNPAIYYMIGVGIYFWAYSDGEVSMTASSELTVEANEMP